MQNRALDASPAAANTMPGAVAVYERARKRNLDARGEDYIFLPKYQNRITASKIIQRQFKELLTRAKVEDDPISGMKHTIYSLRHTAICMRIILSEGQVNIFNLAKNAGTSVDQIERFYARNLPLSKEMAINLQSFGSGTLRHKSTSRGRGLAQKSPINQTSLAFKNADNNIRKATLETSPYWQQFQAQITKTKLTVSVPISPTLRRRHPQLSRGVFNFCIAVAAVEAHTSRADQFAQSRRSRQSQMSSAIPRVREFKLGG